MALPPLPSPPPHGKPFAKEEAARPVPAWLFLAVALPFASAVGVALLTLLIRIYEVRGDVISLQEQVKNLERLTGEAKSDVAKLRDEDLKQLHTDIASMHGDLKTLLPKQK